MRFTKMHGLGNDYVYVNCFEQQVADPPAVARAVSDRHFGVGGDGLILICPSSAADVRMEMYNADGSRAEMCGNGIRCVAKYAVDHGLTCARPLRVETDAGVMTVDYELDGSSKLAMATVNMGEPGLEPASLPVRLAAGQMVAHQIEVRGRKLAMTCASMGNPHAVFFLVDLAGVELGLDGPFVENHELFPERVNAHFVRADSRDHVTMATWERGSGATLACGTGAIACALVGSIRGMVSSPVKVKTKGGEDLIIHFRRKGDSFDEVWLQGNTSIVYQGQLHAEAL